MSKLKQFWQSLMEAAGRAEPKPVTPQPTNRRRAAIREYIARARAYNAGKPSHLHTVTSKAKIGRSRTKHKLLAHEKRMEYRRQREWMRNLRRQYSSMQMNPPRRAVV